MTGTLSSVRRAASCLIALLVFGVSLEAMAGEPLAIRAARIYVGDGRVVEPGIVLITEGRISAVGTDLAIPSGMKVVEVPAASVTPGLIDANARVGSTNLIAPSRRFQSLDALRGGVDPWPPDEAPVYDGPHIHDHDPHEVDSSSPQATHREDPLHVGEEFPDEEPPLASGVLSSEMVNDQSSEVVPHTSVLDGLNLASSDFDRLVREGVTTVYVSPDPSAVIAARGAVVHTQGNLSQRVLVPLAAVKATIGPEPSYVGSRNGAPSRSGLSLYARRPNSRMGLVWVFRKAFYDAQRRQQGQEPYGADTAAPEAMAVLADVLAGQVPLRIQARLQRDILTALRLAQEFGLRFTLEDAAEAYLCLEELKTAQVPIVLGPVFEPENGRRPRMENVRTRYATFRQLLEAGIPVALSAQEYRDEDGLARQALYAMRFGVSRDDVLRAVTLWPAQMLGLEHELGTVEAGKRADLVVWDGEPFAATSRIVAVTIDGQLVVDRRE